MTLRLTLGVDPGLTGALVWMVDGELADYLDMPTKRVNGVGEVCGRTLTEAIRAMRALHPGSYVSAVVEKVQGRQGWGATQGFRFGSGVGKVKGVLESLGIEYIEVPPVTWKRHMGLLKSDKDASRNLAIARFPSRAEWFARKKDDGRAEAALVALWYEAMALSGRAKAA